METWNRIQEIRSPKSNTSRDSSSVIPGHDDENDQFITELFGSPTLTVVADKQTHFIQQLKALEVEPRQSFSFDVWKFWVSRKATHAEISAVASVVLATPSNQVSVERAFSALALILTNSRSTLGEGTLNNLMMVKLNKEVFDSILPAMTKD